MDEIDLLKKDILELLTPVLMERAGRIYIQNEEYQESVRKSDVIFEELDASLTEVQSEMLERYFTQNNRTVAIIEKLIYQQGVADFLNLFIAILRKDINE